METFLDDQNDSNNSTLTKIIKFLGATEAKELFLFFIQVKQIFYK